MSNFTLHQFSSSHFNEKARWALDFKAIANQRVSYLPGPHIPAIKKLTQGNSSTTPVLKDSNHQTVQGSDGIIDYLQKQYPEPDLYGENETDVLSWQTRLDAELGPAVRTTVFTAFVQEPGYLLRTFGGDKPLLKRLAYRAMLPILVPVIKKANGVDAGPNIEHCRQVTESYLDEIAAQVQGTGYLVGAKFTLADLSAASLLGPLANVEHPDMRRPQPVPESLQILLDRYAHHDTILWVNKMHNQHMRR